MKRGDSRNLSLFANALREVLGLAPLYHYPERDANGKVIKKRKAYPTGPGLAIHPDDDGCRHVSAHWRHK